MGCGASSGREVKKVSPSNASNATPSNVETMFPPTPEEAAVECASPLPVAAPKPATPAKVPSPTTVVDEAVSPGADLVVPMSPPGAATPVSAAATPSSIKPPSAIRSPRASAVQRRLNFAN